MADASHSKCDGGDPVRVRIPLPAPPLIPASILATALSTVQRNVSVPLATATRIGDESVLAPTPGAEPRTSLIGRLTEVSYLHVTGPRRSRAGGLGDPAPAAVTRQTVALKTDGERPGAWCRELARLPVSARYLQRPVPKPVHRGLHLCPHKCNDLCQQ